MVNFTGSADMVVMRGFNEQLAASAIDDQEYSKFLPIAAEMFAVAAHCGKGQRSKYTPDWYVEHPRRVSNRLRSLGFSEEAVAAAMLHDVLEDTEIDEYLMRNFFTPLTVDLVLEVTDVSKPEDGCRAKRKAIDRNHLKMASYYGKSIKLADLNDNSKSIIKHDPEFAKVFMLEMRDTLPHLKDGHPELYEEACGIVAEYYHKETEEFYAANYHRTRLLTDRPTPLMVVLSENGKHKFYIVKPTGMTNSDFGSKIPKDANIKIQRVSVGDPKLVVDGIVCDNYRMII